MEKIYLIKCSNENHEFVSSVATSKKVAKAICKLRNLQNAKENNEYRYSYDETSINWKSTDLLWIEDRIAELEMKELPY